MAKAKPKPDLVELCQSLPGRRRNWLELVPPERMPDLERVREAYQSGRIAAAMETLRKALGAELGITIEKNSFAEWLRDGRSTQKA